MRGQAVGALALVAAVGFGAAGCGEDSPKPGPVAESSDAPETAVSPAYPEAATTPTNGSAKSYVRYYVTLINEAQASGQTDLLKSASNDCSGCNVIATKIDEVYSSGGSISGGEWAFSKPRVDKSGKQTVVSGLVNTTSGSITMSSGGPTTDYDAIDDKLTQFKLEFRSNRWVTVGLVQP